MSHLRKLILLTPLVFGSTVLVFHNPAWADPPEWAPAHGYRSKHASDHKPKHHHKRHRHEEGNSDQGYRYQHHRTYRHDKHDDFYNDDRDGHRYAHRHRGPRNGYDDDEDAHRYDERYEHPPMFLRNEQPASRDSAPVFVNGKCTPRLTGVEAGAALGKELGSQMTTGNPVAAVAGSLIGAMLGSQVSGPIAMADQDCIGQVLERAADREEVAWDNTALSTRYELTPTRTYRQGGRTCREFVTTVVRNGEPREVYNTACRDSDGRWRIAE